MVNNSRADSRLGFDQRDCGALGVEFYKEM